MKSLLFGTKELFKRGIVGGVSAVLLVGSAMAQSTTPTAEQLQIFNSLDSSQQQSIMQSLGLGGAATGNSPLGGGNTATRPTSGGASLESQRQLLLQQRLMSEKLRIPVLKGDDTVLVDIDFPQTKTVTTPGVNGQPPQTVVVPAPVRDPPLSDTEKQQLRDLISLVRSKNPYRLSHDGALLLPGFTRIPLSGLTVEQGSARVGADPAFKDLGIKLTLLPVDKPGPAGLKPFGYDIFEEVPSTFAPVTDVPVPADYVVGAGDELSVQLYGSTNRTVRLIVSRDGRISFPELGPISVGGKIFSAVQADIENRVSRQMIGVHASVSMGETRSIRVFVMGEAVLPGSYTVSGLASMTTALFASGGVKPIGSLRNIQLKRQGNIVRTLDLYDMLLNGDTSNDAKLLPGDVIFIPPVSGTVAIEGEVRRPAIYELKGTLSVAEMVAMAGGTTADADVGKVSLTRIDGDQQRVVLDVGLNGAGGTAQLKNGDALNVARLAPTIDSGVTVEGHLFAPRSVAWRTGLRVSDVISSVDQLKPNADIHYLLIRREMAPDRHVAVLSADLTKALANKGGDADVLLQPRDRITVFDFETDRARVITPFLDELKLQSHVDRPTEVVTVAGRIKVPGDYPLEPSMKVSDLIRAGGGMQDAAFAATAELTRYVDKDGKRTTVLVNVDLAAIARGDVNADVALQSADVLNVKEVPQWSEHEQVTLRGEVRFPGTYPIQRGETLKSVIQRAGGLTELAFKQGSVFTREDLRRREQEQLDLLASRMQSDLAVLALQGAQTNQGGMAQSLSVGQSLLAQLKATKAVGRLVIDLDRIVNNPAGLEGDVMLRDGDTLIVPKQSQEVTVLGEVQTTTSHLYRSGLTRDDYIEQSGGVTRKADNKQIYVVHANGSVVSKAGSRWFQSSVRIQPGDTVVVPLDTERMPALPMWQAITQIIYNSAIAVAAVNSL